MAATAGLVLFGGYSGLDHDQGHEVGTTRASDQTPQTRPRDVIDLSKRDPSRVIEAC